ncbi:hypothetical protein [Granulicella tundricola]|uniref:Uncharacterized protein n=1 Tax=Granulicella tundricola (strain ATCC BAA-1859 / DSM 23138 / MP5ACTX9) TaxID=1198114 RepID=E8X342_GRATM|nr:hypothetical protein [Granulicella tundricola]ADW69266.1 hypothetical protein AciX9_2224 [Granulicella tundricola MP5ACTX9]
MAGLLVVGIPFLVVCVVVASFIMLSTLSNRRNVQFAAARGVTYEKHGKTPIAVPKVVYGQRDLNETSSFLYGPWHGVDCFACDFRIGWGRGSVEWLSMVAIHAELQAVSGLDLKRWVLTPLNGWTFLVPREPKGGTLKIKKVIELWDLLAAAIPNIDQRE